MKCLKVWKIGGTLHTQFTFEIWNHFIPLIHNGRSKWTPQVLSSFHLSVEFPLITILFQTFPFSRISQIHKFIQEEEEEESNPSDSQDLLRECALHVQVTYAHSSIFTLTLIPYKINLFIFQFSFLTEHSGTNCFRILWSRFFTKSRFR